MCTKLAVCTRAREHFFMGSNVLIEAVAVCHVQHSLCDRYTSMIAYICIPAPGAKVPVSHAYACMGTTSRICDSLARHIVTDERLLISHSFRRRPKDGQLTRKQKKKKRSRVGKFGGQIHFHSVHTLLRIHWQ